MRAQPKTWLSGIGEDFTAEYDDTPRVHHFPNGDVLVECTIVDPPSMQGRSVNMHITAAVGLALMKELRDAQRMLRSKPMDAEP